MKLNRVWYILSALMVMSAGCDDSSSSKDALCGGNECAGNEVCNTVKMKCELPNGCGNICREGAFCDEATKSCRELDTCNNCDGRCSENQVCNTSTCMCEANVCNDCDGRCTGGLVCDTSTCQCKAPTCTECEGGCGGREVCNLNTCACELCEGLIYNGRCVPFAENCFGGCSDEYEICTVEGCLSKACDGLTWDEENCYCSITGKLWNNDLVHVCGDETTLCEEAENNVVLNWSFEDWTSTTSPKNWSLYVNSTAQNRPTLAPVDKPQSCKKAVRFKNAETKVARLESAPIVLPDKTFSGGNLKFDCTAFVRGTGDVNFGYRGLDKDGNKIKVDTKEAAGQRSLFGGNVYVSYSWEASFSESESFQVLIGLSKTEGGDNADVIIDSVSCVQQDNLCTGKTCDNAWEICDINGHTDETGKHIGLCIPKDGYCSINDDDTDTCSEWEKCNPNTHICESVDGKCENTSACTDDAKPVCVDHTCVEGDPCENVTCNEFRECTLASRGKCVLKPGVCQTSADCPRDTPVCYGKKHQCTGVESVYTVDKRKDCLIEDDYFAFLNYVDEDEKKGQLYDSLVCPINIIPNGSFEEWDEFRFKDTSAPHDIPAFWYAMEDFNNFTNAPWHLLTELPFDNLSDYTQHKNTGEHSLKIEYTKAPAKRLTSWGFKVPGGTWDCSYWVRGTGDVRVHTFSTRGEAKKTEFVSYDTENWTRATFEIKEAASDARIVIYVSNTNEAKDHIQLDDFACVKRGDFI